MDLGSGITLPKHSGCQANGEIPSNSSFVGFESGNAVHGPQGCLDLLKSLGGTEGVLGSEGLYCATSPFQFWSQFPSCSLGEPVAAGSYMFASGSGSCQGAPHFDHSIQVNVGEIAQSGSHNMISVPWNDYGIGFVPQVINGTACSEAVAQFTPVTPDKNRVVSADLHRDVSSNKGIGLEVYIRGVTDNSKPAEECSVRCTVERENLPFTGSSAEFQGVYAGLSAPETPDKWRTILPGMTSENCRFPFPKTLEGSQQKGSGNALADTNHVEIAPNSCPGMQQDVQNSIVENNLADNEQATPQQKPRRKKHRPKVVIEGKQAKQKKASTPKPVSTPEIPGIKRKYVRKPKVNLPENLFGGSTLDTPPVKRKYVRKQKTDSPETGGSGEGEQAGGGSVQQSVKRSLNFSVEDASMESPYKNVCTEGNRQADSQHKPNIDGDVPCNLSGSACSNVQNVPNSMRKDVYCNVQDISHDMKNDAHFNVQNVSQNVSANMGGMADRSSQNTYVGGCSINHIQKECNFQGFLLHSSQSPRKNVLRENLKTLARENQRTGNSFTQGFHLPYSSTTGITKNKRSKRERSSVTPDYRSRSFILQNGFYTPNLNTNSPSCSQPLQFIPEQCKRKRSKAGQSEHHHDAPSPSAVHVSSQVGSSKDSQKIPPSVAAKEAPGQTQSEIKSKDSLLPASVPSVEAPRCSQLKVRFFNSSSSQVRKESLIAQANAACSSQLPPVAPRPKQLQIRFSNPSSSQVSQSNSMCFGQSPPVPQAAIQYYQSPSSVRPKAVTEGLQSKIPKSRAKKVQTPQLNGAYGMSSMFPPQSHMLGSSHAPLHFSFPQCNTHELIDWLIWKLIRLNINGVSREVLSQINQHEKALVVYQGSGAMVPFDNLSSPPKKKKPRARVDLDSETNRVWLLLMGAVNVNGPEGTDAEKEKWWEEERRVFHGRAESFIARMHLVQGDRRFSPWKGSVVDSVVGVFLTQNVSDHLSSSAFMNLTSRFPVRRTPDWCKTPTENGDIYLVEFDECTKGEEKVQSGPINSLKSMVLISEDGESTEDKEILQVGQSLGEDCGITSNASGKLVHVPQLTAESINHVDSKCIESLDGIVINLNAVASSQSSPSRPIRKDGATGMGLQFCIDIPSLEDKRRCCNVNTSSSFSELLQLASDNLINFQQQGPFASVTYEQESLSGNMKNTNFSYANKLEDSSPSAGKLDFYLHGEQNAFRGIEYIPSQHPNAYPCEYHDLVTEKIQEGRGKMSSSPEAMLGVGDRCGIENSCINSCTKGTIEPTSQETSVLNSHITSSCDSHTKFSNHSDGSQGEVHSDQHSCNQSSPPTEREISFPRSNCLDNHPMASNCSPVDLSFAITDFQGMKKSIQALDQISSCKTQELQLGMCQNSSTSDSKELSLGGKADAQTSTITELKPQNEKVHNEVINPEKPKRKRAEKTPIEPIDWDLLRKEACTTDLKKERSRETMDSVDWETIRRADVSELSDAIRERGMNNRLAQRIKEFLDRLVHDHGSIDLEWLRDAPPDKVKDYLLSVKGLGLKSVECVRLLTLHHLAFPVDTNVGRICVRLGWVPLQPLPESLQLHLLELYPMLETIQKYLWPRLCKLDQRTLYELHYQMITFGKVFCTKSKPNCNACPMRGECKHFASAFASARLALPGPEEKSLVTSAAPIPSVQEPKPSVKLMALPQPENSPLPEECAKNVKLMALPQPENSPLPEASAKGNCEPIIEEPSTPEPECIEAPEAEIEDLFYEDPDEIPTIKLNIEKFTENLQNIMQENNMELQETDISKALVALTPNAASIPQPKLKNVSRLRTEHQVYELPDSHPLVEGLDQREPDDPSPYLLAIWSPGETAQSMELPQASCSSRETGILCNNETCSACNGIREARAQIVRGTLLIPCRTAMRGSFPLNGTYFQVNEVFADHSSSLSPIDIPRQWIWNLPRRTVYFGTSMPTIFKGLATEQIQQCFWRGFVCVRGFDRETRAPRPLMARLHFPASKAQRNKKVDAKEKQGQ